MEVSPAAVVPAAAAETGPGNARFAAAVAAEQLRLAADFEERYRRSAVCVEQAARDAARAEIADFEEIEARCLEGGGLSELAALQGATAMELSAIAKALPLSPPSRRVPNIAPVADDRTRREILALRGELVQEAVVAEELLALEAAKAAHLRNLELEASASAPSSQGIRRTRPPRSSVSDGQLLGEVCEERACLRQLEQQAWQGRNMASAADAKEALLLSQNRDMEQRLQAGEFPPHLTQPEEMRQMRMLEASEAKLAEQVLEAECETAAAQQAAEQLEGRTLDLESECGVLMLGAHHERPDLQTFEAAHVRELLERAAPDHVLNAVPGGEADVNVGTLDVLLERLEADFSEVQEELCTTPDGALEGDRDAALREAHAQAKMFAQQTELLEDQSKRCRERLADVEAETSRVKWKLAELDDCATEAAQLQRENELLQRQRIEWEQSHARMVRMIEDLERDRAGTAQSQAAVAARLTDLRPVRDPRQEREHQAPRRQPGAVASTRQQQLEDFCQQNNTLVEQIARLEEEKIDLLHSQQGLIAFVKSKMPRLESAVYMELKQAASARESER